MVYTYKIRESNLGCRYDLWLNFNDNTLLLYITLHELC